MPTRTDGWLNLKPLRCLPPEFYQGTDGVSDGRWCLGRHPSLEVGHRGGVRKAINQAHQDLEAVGVSVALGVGFPVLARGEQPPCEARRRTTGTVSSPDHGRQGLG